MKTGKSSVLVPNRLRSIPLLVGLALALSAQVYAQLPSTIDLKNAEEDVTIYGGIDTGSGVNDRLTNSRLMATGDLNADGYRDLILGTVLGDGPSDNRFNCGEAYIIFGNDVLSEVTDIEGVVGPAPDVVIYGASERDQLTLGGGIVGDLNDDGIDDLVLNATFADGPDDSRFDRSGETYILFGRSPEETWPAVVDLATDYDVIIYGAAPSDNFGAERAFLIDDFDGDHINDLAIGANSPGDAAGRVYVHFGGTTWPTIIDTNTSTSYTHADVTIYGVRGGGGSIGDHLTNDGGMTSADLNGDGIADLVLVAHNAVRDPDVTSNEFGDGEAYIVYGGSSIPSSIHLGSDTSFTTIQPGFPHGRLGRERTVLAGDVNGDGLKDLVLGAYNAQMDVGKAYIVYGAADLSSASLLTLEDDANVIVTGSGPVTLGGLLAVGDINGDRYKDVVLGTQNGKVSIVYGQATNSNGQQVVSLDQGQEDVIITNCPVPVRQMLFLGDVNSDGFDDVIAGGGVFDGPSGDPRPDSGGAWVVYGGTELTGEINQVDVVVHGASAGDQLNFNVRAVGSYVAGDITGDGVDDMVFASQWADGPSEERTNAGEAYVIFGATFAEQLYRIQTGSHGNVLPEDFASARAVVDFLSGDVPSDDVGSTTTITLFRDDVSVGIPDLTRVADVTWVIETDRTDFAADVTFRYLADEVAGLDESKLGVYVAPTADGVYATCETVLDVHQNLAIVQDLSHFGSFILLDQTEADADGLPDAFETNTGIYVNDNDTGTDPLNSDTDGDGLLDGTEVDMGQGSGCPNPLDADSDDDGLTDGQEVNLGTSPCNPDTDGDGISDLEDPTPLDSGVPSSWLEAKLRFLAEQVLTYNLSLFDAPNSNAAKGRRTALSNKLMAAANAVASGDLAAAVDQLLSLQDKLDGSTPPPDWMVEGLEKYALANWITILISLID